MKYPIPIINLRIFQGGILDIINIFIPNDVNQATSTDNTDIISSNPDLNHPSSTIQDHLTKLQT